MSITPAESEQSHMMAQVPPRSIHKPYETKTPSFCTFAPAMSINMAPLSEMRIRGHLLSFGHFVNAFDQEFQIGIFVNLTRAYYPASYLCSIWTQIQEDDQYPRIFLNLNPGASCRTQVNNIRRMAAKSKQKFQVPDFQKHQLKKKMIIERTVILGWSNRRSVRFGSQNTQLMFILRCKLKPQIQIIGSRLSNNHTIPSKRTTSSVSSLRLRAWHLSR